MNIEFLIAFAIYFCILVAIGLIFYVKNKSAQDFMLGNRSLNYFVTAIAAQASDMSSWLFLAFPAAVYYNGFFELWTAIGLTIFMYLNWQFVAPKIRAATEKYQSLTLSSYFNSRFKDSTGSLRLVSALFCLLFFTFYISSGLVGMGRLFEGIFGISYHTGIFIGLLSALVYTLVGGFFAVAWCNLFQGIFMLAMLVLVASYSLFFYGGWDTISAVAQANHISLSLFPEHKSILHSLLLVASWGLGYFGQPHILVYFMSIDDVRTIKYAKYVGITWMILALGAASLVGISGLAIGTYPIANPEMLFIIITKQLFIPIIAGFVLCGIFAATLSTMNSHILIAGSVLAEDIYKKYISPQASSMLQVWANRFGSLAISLVALTIAFNNSSTIYDLVNYAWSGLGSAFGPLLLLSLYSRSVSYAGAMSGIIVGGTVAAIWPFLNSTLMPMVPGFGLSLLAILAVSALAKR